MSTGPIEPQHACRDCAQVRDVVLEIRTGIFGDPADANRPGMVGRIASLEGEVNGLKTAHADLRADQATQKSGVRDWLRMLAGVIAGAVAGHYSGNHGGPSP